MSSFSLDYTFWLNLVLLALAIWLFVTARHPPMRHDHGHEDHAAHHHGDHAADHPH